MEILRGKKLKSNESVKGKVVEKRKWKEGREEKEVDVKMESGGKVVWIMKGDCKLEGKWKEEREKIGRMMEEKRNRRRKDIRRRESENKNREGGKKDGKLRGGEVEGKWREM